ncbi:MAG: polyamine aminopropyltransferase [Syntrophobacterales bacterium]|nr:polyamine aminopropyltransferase [Syntrophobacterales bacterium]
MRRGSLLEKTGSAIFKFFANTLLTPSSIIKLSVFVAGFSGILIEYVISTVASYLIGNTLFQWAIIISLFLFAMGLGSRVTGHIKNDEANYFILVESLITITVAIFLPTAYAAVAYPVILHLVLYGATLTTGVLIGMEIPLLIRLNSRFEELPRNLSRLLEKDYMGALFGGLFFAFVGLSFFGPLTLGLMVATLNWLIALICWLSFRQVLKRAFIAVIALAGIITFASFPLGNALASWGEEQKYRDEIIYSEQSPYQRIVMTKWRQFFWLYLDGHLQFSSYDEYRYHETLVHPAMMGATSRSHVLILGGGDGLGAREVLKYPDVESITIVDIDPAITRLAKNHPLLVDLNDSALNNPKVKVINEDAGVFLEKSSHLWNVIIVDLPDPRTPTLERLYSVEFYRTCKNRLAKGGVIVTQATSPIFSPHAFWCIAKSVNASGLHAIPIHAYIPTFGDWGWVIGSEFPVEIFRSRLEKVWTEASLPLKFLNLEVLKTLFVFSPADRIDFQAVEVNSFFKPVLYRYYKQGIWSLDQ